MDEHEFKKVHDEVNDRPCVFAKAVLRGCAACSRSEKVLIAEREAIACQSPGGHQRCSDLVAHLRENALFALHLRQLDGPLPHGKEMKVECGGLLGLNSVAEGADAEHVEDIDALVGESLTRWHGFEQLPYSRISQWVVKYQSRRRR
ncbi:hypothetical protein [Thiohalomonas denitrificans]|uniref:Uncharacterized protein n=1 Tax=Thiohalomonas denitrificans TaxID=415747 RepID=A0A1G5PRT8_9GAMM|nr:hypothetical protein [Thiohalomonas denitrificans]SCZ51759.1 hypothetical protein SAMN03097708_00579 [Thiohalomonas denitrificans]